MFYVAKPRPSSGVLVREAFERHAGPVPEAGISGIPGSLDPWLRLHELTAFESVRARNLAAPFPPAALMHRTSGLDGARGVRWRTRLLLLASARPSDFEPVRIWGHVHSEVYITRNWSRYFELQDIVRGAIHDFQDIVVLRRRDDYSTPEPER
jgi:hypothetical protein